MEPSQFDRLTRGIARGATRRGALAGLLGGITLPLMGAALADARNRRGRSVQAEKKRKKCKSGLLKCTIKKGRKKKRFCVDAQTDPANCGGCGILCAAGQGCQGGVCTCNGTICAGCCDGTTCQAGTSNQQCGVNGGVCQVCTGGRSCQSGVCTCPAGQTFCGGACVDTKTDAGNCGACGNACGGGNDCNAATCTNGVCGTTPISGASCNAGTGTCNATGQCIATVCAGKDAPNPCFEGIAPFCNAANTCNCGSDLDGNVACYENAYCNNINESQCTSNADCVAKGFAVGSICFSATNCCLGATGCTTPCPSPPPPPPT